MKSKTNLLCAFISVLPLIVLAFAYQSLPDYVSPKTDGHSGIPVTKQSFVLLAAISGVLFYYASFTLSTKLIMLYSFVSQPVIRIFINLLGTAAIVMTIFANLGR